MNATINKPLSSSSSVPSVPSTFAQMGQMDRKTYAERRVSNISCQLNKSALSSNPSVPSVQSPLGQMGQITPESLLSRSPCQSITLRTISAFWPDGTDGKSDLSHHLAKGYPNDSQLIPTPGQMGQITSGIKGRNHWIAPIYTRARKGAIKQHLAYLAICPEPHILLKLRENHPGQTLGQALFDLSQTSFDLSQTSFDAPRTSVGAFSPSPHRSDATDAVLTPHRKNVDSRRGLLEQSQGGVR